MSVRDLVSTWVEAKTAKLKLQAEKLKRGKTLVESERGVDEDRFVERKAEQEQLRAYHRVRQDGGPIASLLELRSLLVFGCGCSFESDDPDLVEWLDENVRDLDTLTTDLGADIHTYGYALAEIQETQAGGFHQVLPAQPWTMIPVVQNGRVSQWEQHVKQNGGGRKKRTHSADDILHFKTFQSDSRDPVGMSLLGRAMEQARNFRDNQRAIQNSLRLHAFPKWHIKVGRDGGHVVDENELRRLRPEFQDINEQTKWVTGRNVDIEPKSPGTIDYDGLTERDLNQLAITFMLPIELTQMGGGDGLGTGFPAQLRKLVFLRSGKAEQDKLSDQLVEQVAVPLLTEYGGFDGDRVAEADLRVSFEDPIVDIEDMQAKVEAIGKDMKVNERRALFDLPSVEDDEIGESFTAPGLANTKDARDRTTEEQATGASLQQAGVASDVLRWAEEYVNGTGDVQSRIAEFREWASEVATDPTEPRDPILVTVTLFANSQGISLEQAWERPVRDLISYLARHRDLQATDEFWFEDVFDAIHEKVVCAEDVDRKLFGFTEKALPGVVMTNILDAVFEGSEVFSDLKNVSDSQLMEFRTFMAGKLTEDGWTISEMRDELQDSFDVEPHIAENMARSTTQNMVNEAAEKTYKDRGRDEEELRFRWSGPSDDRTSDVCENIKAQVPGEGLPLDELKQLVHNEAGSARGWTPHPQCRHRFVRVVG